MGAQYSVNWEGPVSSAAATISAGSCVCPTSGGFVVATSANRTTYGRPSGVAVTSGNTSIPIQIIEAGPLTATQTGLGAGTAAPIRVSAAGGLERVVTPSSSDDVAGYCFTDGSAHVMFGVLTHRVYVDASVDLATNNADVEQESTEIATTDATPTTVGTTFSIPANTVLTVDVQVIVQRAGGDRSKVFNIRRYLQNASGTVTAPAQENTLGPTEVGGALSCSVAISYTGTTGRVDFTGIAATSMRVRVDRQITTLTAADPAIVVSAISPNTGAAAGGDAVSITVDSSVGCTGATVGGVALTSFAIVDATHVSGTTGAHAAGAVDVIVTNAEGSGTLAGGFTYSAAAFDPLTLPDTSGTALLWLDPTDCTNTGNGTDVTAANDKASGSMTLGITGHEPTFNSANADYANAPTFDCGAAQGFLLTTTGLTTTAFTVVIVGDGTDGVWFQDGNGNYLANAGGGSGNKVQITSAAGPYLVGATAKSGVPGVYVLVFNGASSKVYTSAYTADASGDAGTLSTLSGVTIGLLGTYNMTGNGLMGSCRHALIYDGALSQTDVEYLLDGFGDESGITIGA